MVEPLKPYPSELFEIEALFKSKANYRLTLQVDDFVLKEEGADAKEARLYALVNEVLGDNNEKK